MGEPRTPLISGHQSPGCRRCGGSNFERRPDQHLTVCLSCGYTISDEALMTQAMDYQPWNASSSDPLYDPNLDRDVPRAVRGSQCKTCGELYQTANGHDCPSRDDHSDIEAELLEPLSVDDDTLEEQLIEAASTPNLASLFKAGKAAGLIKPAKEYGSA